MKISNNVIKETLATFKLALDVNDLEEIKNKTLIKLRASVKIPGFRPNKAPIELVEKNIDQSTFQNEVINEAFSKYYPLAVNELKLRVVNDPRISIDKLVPFSLIEFKIEVDVIPEIKLKDYKSIKIDLKKDKVTNKEIDGAIQEILNRSTSYQEVKRASKLKDQLNFDFKGTDFKTKQEIKEATSTNFNLVLGSQTFIPGFEENLVGLKKAETKSFVLTFPKDYHVQEFKLRKVNFEVKINEVKEPISAQLNLEFVKNYGPFKSVEEFKEELKKQLQIEKDNQFKRLYDEQLLLKLADKIDLKLPESMIESEFTIMKDEDRQKTISRGQTWQEYLASINDTEESYDKKLKDFAELRIKSGLAIGEIAKKEDVIVSEDELNKYIEDLNKYYSDPKMREEINNPANRNSFKAQLLSSKTLEKVKSIISKN